MLKQATMRVRHRSPRVTVYAVSQGQVRTFHASELVVMQILADWIIPVWFFAADDPDELWANPEGYKYLSNLAVVEARYLDPVPVLS